MSGIGIVTALAAEARTLSPHIQGRGPHELAGGFFAIISGIGASHATTAARTLVSNNVDALVSWGTAAGLDPALSCGTILLPQTIQSHGMTLSAHPSWQRQVLERLNTLDVSSQSLAESPVLLTTPDAKRQLRQATGAAAADMETAAIARVALECGLPFLCVRVIVDTAGEAVPSALPGLLNDDGGVRWLALLQKLLHQPALVADLLRLGRRFARARRSLQAVGHNLTTLELPQT